MLWLPFNNMSAWGEQIIKNSAGPELRLPTIASSILFPIANESALPQPQYLVDLDGKDKFLW